MGIPISAGGRLDPPTVTPDMPRRGWRNQAKCLVDEVDPAVFDVDQARPKPEALAVCAQCPVRGDCLAFEAPFERNDPAAGRGTVFAGLSRPERAAWYLENPGPVVDWRDLLPPVVEDVDPDPDSKLCRVCDSWLPLDAFDVRRASKDGRQAQCRDCKRELRVLRRAEQGLTRRQEDRRRLSVRERVRLRVDEKPTPPVNRSALREFEDNHPLLAEGGDAA